jgi:hypothetical protein
MVPHRGVPVVAVRVSERHRRGSERGYDEDSKSLLENVFHGNPGGSMGVSDEKRDAMPQTTAMRRHFNVVTDFESGGRLWEHVRASRAHSRHAWLQQGCTCRQGSVAMRRRSATSRCSKACRYVHFLGPLPSFSRHIR